MAGRGFRETFILLNKFGPSGRGEAKVEYLDGRTHRWIAASQAAAISVTAFRLTMVPNPASSPSPLIGLPMVFARGFASNQVATAR